MAHAYDACSGFDDGGRMIASDCTSNYETYARCKLARSPTGTSIKDLTGWAVAIHQGRCGTNHVPAHKMRCVDGRYNCVASINSIFVSPDIPSRYISFTQRKYFVDSITVTVISLRCVAFQIRKHSKLSTLVEKARPKLVKRETLKSCTGLFVWFNRTLINRNPCKPDNSTGTLVFGQSFPL